MVSRRFGAMQASSGLSRQLEAMLLSVGGPPKPFATTAECQGTDLGVASLVDQLPPGRG